MSNDYPISFNLFLCEFTPKSSEYSHIPDNDIEEIYVRICATHPDFPRPSRCEFIHSVNEVVENSAEEEEQRILDTYQPAPVYESDSDAGDIQDVPVTSCNAALEGLEPRRL